MHQHTPGFTIRMVLILLNRVIGFENNNTPSLHNQALHLFLKQFGRPKLPPRIHHFLWRCLTGNINVGETMAKKKLIKDADCPRCGTGAESINHILFECGFARVVWAASSAGFLFFPYPSSSLFTNMAACLLPQDSDDDGYVSRFKSWPWLLWRIWKARNDLCRDNQQVQVLKLVSLAEADALGWELANTKAPSNETNSNQAPIINSRSNRNLSWQKQLARTFKCNSNGSWKQGDHTSGVGWVLRDDTGTIRWYGSKTYPNLASPLEVEAVGLAWAMSVLNNLKIANVTFEIDCRELFLALRQPQEWYSLKTVDEIGKHQQALHATFTLCTRNANGAADLLAKKARTRHIYSAEVDCILPAFLTNYLESNVTNLHLSV